jgi:exopolyphosphatase / guanosine-5'-triphosphate,3'-diphosphate pyrophosphatase
MKAAIDIGSNSLRMLVGDVSRGQVVPERYFRQVTRLAGGYDPLTGISAEACERTLCALELFARVCDEMKPTCTRAVATEAVRRAGNGQQFIAEVRARTGFDVEIIDGVEEAVLSSAGVLSALKPQPTAALIFDIGGGSTEFIMIKGGKRLWQKSYPLGVVGLAEATDPGFVIERAISVLAEDLRLTGLSSLLAGEGCELVGTAGTVTTLAAADLAMTEYDWQRINNYILPQSTLRSLYERLLPLTPTDRELLAGVEKGRGDLIVHGAAIVLALLQLLGKNHLRISDFGLLEGVILSMR